MPPEAEDDIEFEKGDHVGVKGTGEMGRIIGPGDAPGTWKVLLVDRDGKTQEVQFASDAIEPIY
ncbi:hypothetical protein [Gemmata sp.]|uniref:hypothetical protein n=1 Tax=Gemmata sp. TaxID=1914242 RepID=UPI003F6E66E6